MADDKERAGELVTRRPSDDEVDRLRRRASNDRTGLALRLKIEDAQTPEEAQRWIEVYEAYQNGCLERTGRRSGEILKLLYFLLCLMFGAFFTERPEFGSGMLNWIFFGAALFLVAPDYVRLVIAKLPSINKPPSPE